ncbi:MAG: M28 family peptidase [Candidatus Aminicenantes bacterium]|nr:M28 family peptidase [Candidatus Aminicenantes bacterium]
MKRARLFLPVFMACGLLFALSLPRSKPVSLVKVLKDRGPVWAVLERLQIDVRQELETCFLALADREDLRALRKNRVAFSIIDREAGGIEDYFIVPLRAPGTLDELQARGRAAAVEPRTAVFWTTAGLPMEVLPSELPRKPLSSSSVLPFLRAPVDIKRAAPVSAAFQDPVVEVLAAQVSEAGLRSLVQSLQDFQTRYASTTQCEAAGEFIYNTFSSLGLDDVWFEPFVFSSGYQSRNVIAEKTGETYADDVLIICGHYDSISPSATRQTLAPGADDNASGTAAVIEAARVLAAYPLDFTVRFIAFSAEEWGLWGSRDYAGKARTAGESIIGVINLDMIAYADAMPEDLEVIVNGRSEWLAERLIAAADLYADLTARKTVDPSFVYSDHSPFWDQGYRALLAIEDNPLRNPTYHQTTDTIDKLNFEFFTASARASLALLAELAQPVREGYPRTPIGLTAEPVVYRSLFNAVKSARLSWAAQAGTSGYNVYRTNMSHLDYVKLNDAPVTSTTFTDDHLRIDLPYYYVVTGVGTTGLESNFSREAEISPDNLMMTTQTQVLNFLQMLRAR